MRVLLKVAYDGTSYSGWQIQPNAVTVEQRLTEAVCGLFGENIALTGASRTDAGVHALGNIAVFDVDTRIPPEKISYALNARLPEDIRIHFSTEVPADFHPRYTPCVKTYEYKIWNDTFENPMYRLYAHFCYGDINVDAMNLAAEHIIGTHDFTAFCSAGSQVQDKTRTIYSLEVNKTGHLITIRVKGNGFLYNMVRIIAGTLLQAGMGQIEPNIVQTVIESQNRQNAGPTAPARGLCLAGIEYTEYKELVK